MKEKLIKFGVMLALALGGCVVQSFYPFYTPKAVVVPATVAGQWQQIETTEANKPWSFAANNEGHFNVVAYEKDKPGNLRATFFQIGTNLFCDFLAGEADEKAVSTHWLLHVRPVHSVSLVETSQDRLVLVPLSIEWMDKALKEKTVTLPKLQGVDSDDRLFTASPAEWAQFLAAHAGNTNAFARKNALTFRKLQSP